MDDSRALALKKRALDLLLRLDQLRDKLHEDGNPQEMFDAIASHLKTTFNCESCAILLVEETTNNTELLATAGIPETIAIALCQQALEFSAAHLIAGAPWANTLGVPIILDSFPLGAFLLGRDNALFDSEEFELIALVESQLDSAVMQARMTWKLVQRNHELEAIYDIDRLRDRTTSEVDLINGFTGLVIPYFKADFCLLLLAHTETTDLMIRGIIDKHDLPASALQDIQQKANQITIPQTIAAPAGVDHLQLLAAPFVVGSERLGAVVIGRTRTYTIGDHRLLHAVMSQMDSAIVSLRTSQQLVQRRRELEAIYKIDRIRDREKDLDSMLQAVLTELGATVVSEMSFIALYNQEQEREFDLRAFTLEGRIASPQYLNEIERISRRALAEGQTIFSNQESNDLRSFLALPLILNDRIIGVIGMINSLNSQGFTQEDRRLLQAITSQIDTAIFERLEQRRMRAILSRSVDSKVVEHLLQKANFNVLTGERVHLSVLFADLRGSTEWAERIPPEELVSTLNLFLGQMTDVILEYGGTLDKFVGDMVIGLFGTPVQMDDHAYRATAAAQKMQQVHAELQQKLHLMGKELPSLGIGISSGEAIAGEFGHRIRSEFTAIGRMVNLGSRLCSAAEASEILISEDTFQAVTNFVTATDQGEQVFKGINHPCRVYALVSVLE
jgi:adenylate cyclase